MGILKTIAKVGGGFLAGGGLGAAAGLASGLISSRGTKNANAKQIALSNKQMDFQERMSSTAYQRSADDMEAAGLNRILALGSPASSPGGSMPLIQNELAGTAAGVAAAPSSAFAYKERKAQMKQMQQTLELTEAQKDKTNAEERLTRQNQSLAGSATMRNINESMKAMQSTLTEQQNTSAAFSEAKMKAIEAEWMEQTHTWMKTLGASKAAVEALKALSNLRRGK